MNWIDKLILKIAKDRGLDAEKELRLLKSIINALPDMLWAKSTDGTYIYANKTIIERLLFSNSLENTVNRKDFEMALQRKLEVGNENHTFGGICGNSDFVVLETEEPERFLEFGKVDGRDLYLEVHKDILKDEAGNIIGTVGTGRDITQDYKDLKELLSKIDDLTKEEIKKELDELIDRYFYTSE